MQRCIKFFSQTIMDSYAMPDNQEKLNGLLRAYGGNFSHQVRQLEESVKTGQREANRSFVTEIRRQLKTMYQNCAQQRGRTPLTD